VIVETGSGVSDANSYGEQDVATTIANCKAYATDRGVDMATATDEQVSSWLVNGTDYIESFSSDFVGTQKTITQALSWPRTNVVYPDGSPFPDNKIPTDLIHALYQSVIEQKNGIVLQPSQGGSGSGGKFVTFEKVDVIETKYSETIGTGSQPFLPKVDQLLDGLLTGTMFALRTVRI